MDKEFDMTDFTVEKAAQVGATATLEALKAIKLRLHFMGWPTEPMWNNGTQETPHWIADWRYEIALLEHALHGSPVDAVEKPTDTLPGNALPAPSALPLPDQIINRAVFTAIVSCMESDNGCEFTIERGDFHRVNAAITALRVAGFFASHPDDLDGDYWFAAGAHDEGDAAAHFNQCAEPYGMLSGVLNEIFDRSPPGQNDQHRAVPDGWKLVPLEPTAAMCGVIEYGAASRMCETFLSERMAFLRKAIAAAPLLGEQQP